MDDRLWRHYATFHRLLTATDDLDPVYPVYRDLARRRGLGFEQRVWLVLCHAAYYHTGSALAAFASTNGIGDAGMARTDLPCGQERRGHRAPAALAAHLADIGRRSEDILRWVMLARRYGGTAGWGYLTGALCTIHGNGRWASYKTAELLQNVAGIPLEAPDMGHAHSTGPRKGLALLYEDDLPQGNDRESVRHLDSLSREVVAYLRSTVCEADQATAETSLCDFHSLVSGRYYVGRDIDIMQEQLSAVPGPLTETALAARRDVLQHSYLGEICGRTGVDRPRLRAYLDTGKIVAR